MSNTFNSFDVDHAGHYPKRRTKYIRFKNNKGDEFKLPKTLTLKKMVEKGMKIEIQDEKAPIKDGWWRAEDECN